MIRKMGCQLIYAILLISSTAFSFNLKSEASTNIDLYPNQPITKTNTLTKTITVYCEVRLVSKQNHSILIKVLQGTGLVDGTSLKKGQSMVQTVYHNQIIPIIANPGAQAEFTNLAPNVIKAMCS